MWCGRLFLKESDRDFGCESLGALRVLRVLRGKKRMGQWGDPFWVLTGRMPVLLPVQCDVEVDRRMGQRANADPVHARFSNLVDRLEVDTTGRL